MWFDNICLSLKKNHKMLTVNFDCVYFSGAKITDVFVTIALGKEKFQTSTVKYGGKVNNGVEWFEECDL